MNIIGPTFSFDKSLIVEIGLVASVLDSPIIATDLLGAQLGDPIIFDGSAAPHDLAVPIPHLPGLDEIELAAAAFLIASAPFERTQSVPGRGETPAGMDIALTGVAQGQTVALTGLVLTGLGFIPPAGVAYALQGWDGTVYWYRDGSDTVTSSSSPGGAVEYLHIVIRPLSGSQAGPPSAAAPHFDMPGAGGGLYGPALGGAALTLTRHGDGGVDAMLTMVPAQAMTGVSVIIGIAAEGNGAAGPHAGLPNELDTIGWSAGSGEGHFDARIQDLTVTTHAGGTDPSAGATVAQFPTDPGAVPRRVDFAPAARVGLNDGYPTAAGDDLGLVLRVAAGVAGALYLQAGAVAARYVQRPLPVPAGLQLKGAPDTIEIPLPAGFRPQGLSFRVDGRFGPARLTADADAASGILRDGYRIAGPAQAARRLLLNATERTLPLSRLAVYGRASAEGELLITRHGGDTDRIGPALGPPLSLTVMPSDTPAWHRVDIAARDSLPPHGAAFWITVQATKGVFWWFADMEAGLPASQLSQDGGVSWSTATGRALAQAWVDEVDAATGDPAPLAPLSLAWPAGVLNADIIGVGAGPLPPDFSRAWVATGASSSALFSGIAALARPLALTLNSTRDVDFTVSDVVLTYDPWTAGGSV